MMAKNVLSLNGKNIYLAFHEIAQIIIASQLSKLKYKNVELEKKCKAGRIDIVASKSNKWYLWEVKPRGGKNPDPQIKKYCKATGYSKGVYLEPIEVRLSKEVRIKILFNSRGGAFYAFYGNDNKQIKNATLEKSIKTSRAFKSGLVAVSLVGATLLEDFLTGGAGVANDIQSFSAAAGILIPLIKDAANKAA